ncbi:GNAT family N-acetyltransferase [Flagellimonas aquimarina]|nr:GNAT family N-acetyltransferase [Allomuricauda koreensis]
MSHDSGFVFNLFLKRKLPPFYYNPIRNTVSNKELTSLPWIDIQLKDSSHVLVTDIPDYLDIEVRKEGKNLKMKRVRQYKGFLCNLSGYENHLDYLKDNFSKKTVRNINAKKRQLEFRHAISYIFYYGEIDKSHYDFLFEQFYILLQKRFDEKRIHNRYLLEWKKHYEMVYPKIMRKEASLFVIYREEEPIAIALDFYLEDISFGYIQVFNSDYKNYYIGDICMVKRLEWLLANNISVFDFLMGQTYYKMKWSNLEYFYHHHLFYKHNSVIAFAKMCFMAGKLELRQFLRDRGLPGKKFSMDKYLFRRMSKKLKNFDWKNPQSSS